LKSTRDTAAALRDYEVRCIPRTSALVYQFYRFGQPAQLENPLASWLRNAMVRLAPARFMAKPPDAILRLEDYRASDKPRTLRRY